MPQLHLLEKKASKYEYKLRKEMIERVYLYLNYKYNEGPEPKWLLDALNMLADRYNRENGPWR